MFKFIFWVVFLVFLGVCYRDGVKPFVEARKETRAILQQANISPQNMPTGHYREQSIALLKENCQHGYYEISLYEFRCASNSLFPFIN